METQTKMQRKPRSRCRVMWGTKAIHKLGDISRDRPDYCVVDRKPVDGNYIGNWITGFGFVEVKFPIATTKGLTRSEMRAFKKLRFGVR